MREVLRGERRQLGRLQDHGAARCNGWGNLSGGHGEGEVPWSDQQARTHGLAAGNHAQGALRDRGVAAIIARGFLTKPPQIFRAIGDLTLRLGKGLSHFKGHQGGEFIGALVHQLKGAAENIGALARGGARPLILDRTGSIEGSHRIIRISGRQRGDGRARRRIFYVKGLAGRRVAPLSANQ